MPVKMSCPNGHAMRIHDEHLGRRVRCPTCRVEVLAGPSEIAVQPAPPPIPEPTPPSPAPPHARPVPPPPPTVVLEARPVEEEAEHRPAPRADRPRTKLKKQRRSRKRIEQTRGLALVSTGLAVQIGRIIFLALAIVVGFGSALSPVGGGLGGQGVGVVAHLLGLAVAGLCFAGTQQTGGRILIISSFIADFLGIPLFVASWIIGSDFALIGGLALGAIFKLIAWVLFVMYLRTLATYLDEEADIDLAEGLIKFTFIVLGEYVLIFAVVMIVTFSGIGKHSPVIAGLFGLVGIVAVIWFIIHCIWYLVNYLQLLCELRDTIGSHGVTMGDMFQSTAEPKPDEAGVETPAGGPEGVRPRLAAEGFPPLVWLLGGVGALLFVLFALGGGGFLVYRKYFNPEARAARQQRNEVEDRFRQLLPSDRDFTERALRGLQATDFFLQKRALDALAKAEPGEQRFEIAAALEKMVADPNVFVSGDAIRLFARWADRETAITRFLVVLAGGGGNRQVAIEALGDLKADRACEPIAARLPDFFDRGPASKALLVIGPPAETAVRKQLTHTDKAVQQEACKILKMIGTQASVGELQTAAKSNDRGLADAAADALANIVARHRLNLSADGTPKPSEKTDTSPMAPAVKKPAREPPSAAKLQGLLAYWDFDDADETKALDVSANEHQGKLQGTKRVTGVRGRALQFSTEEDWFDYGTSPKINFGANAPFTLAAWVRTKERNGALISQRQEKDGAPVLDITMEVGILVALVREDGDEFGQAARVRGKAFVNDDQWHHVVLTRQDDTIELFVDGVSVGKGQGAQAGGAITTDLRALGSERYLLKRRGPGDASFKGLLDEFCIFSRALTPDEIRALAQTRD